MTNRAIPAILLALYAIPAFGADLTASLGGVVEYDNNVFRRPRDRKDDVLFQLRPGIRVHEDRGDDVSYSIQYELPVEFAVDHNEELQDEDHILRSTFSYHVNDRLQVFGGDRFSYLRSILHTEPVDSFEVEAGRGLPTFTEEREYVKLNDVNLGASYMFSPRLMGRFVANSDFFDSSRSDRARNYSIGGVADALYALTPTHQVGGGAGYTYREFEDRDRFEGSQSNVYRVFGSWRWTIDPTLSLDVRAGPTVIESRQDDAAVVRQAPTVPFVVLPGGQVNGRLFDSSGTELVNPTVSPGTLLVPSFFVDAGNGGGPNCGNINGTPVASSCAGNIIIDPINDNAAYNAILQTVGVTNIDSSGGDDTKLTGFAEVTLRKRWAPTLDSALRYSRHEGDASGLGGTVIVDAVSLSNNWQATDRWRISLRGDWIKRDSAFRLRQTFDQVASTNVGGVARPLAGRTGVAFNSSRETQIDTDRWGVAGRVTYSLLRATWIYGQVRYDTARSDGGTLGRSSDFENVRATFGVQHSFEPVKLW